MALMFSSASLVFSVSAFLRMIERFAEHLLSFGTLEILLVVSRSSLVSLQLLPFLRMILTFYSKPFPCLTQDGTCRVWDTASSQCLRSVTIHKGEFLLPPPSFPPLPLLLL